MNQRNGPPVSRTTRNLGALGAVVFASFASLQFNDPDGWTWVATYATAAVLCALAALGRTGAVPLEVTAVAAVVGALPIARAHETLGFDDEVVREVGGLIIVAIWLGALGFAARRRLAVGTGAVVLLGFFGGCAPGADAPPVAFAPEIAPPPPSPVVPAYPSAEVVRSGLDARPPNPTCVAPPRPDVGGDIDVALEPVFDGRRFVEAVWMTQAPDDDRWYVLERAGRVVRLAEDGSGEEVFADLRSLVNSEPSHGGFLGLAFHPDFADNGEVFLSYTTGSWNHLQSHVSRYRLDDQGVVDSDSAELVISLDQPASPHNGGHIEFGPDGYLYIAFGDGQLGGDPPNNALDPETLLGKLLRIDVDSGDPYGIPPDNPLVDDEGRPEIYALGFRNPWRFSFDRATGEMWLGDVGDAGWEEINRVELGGNYGWPGREGAHCFRRRLGCEQPHWIDPVFDYSHDDGISVTGGYVYRGEQIPALVGTYLFSDYGSGTLWALDFDEAGHARRRTLRDTGFHVASFSESHDGEIYIVDYDHRAGGIYRLVEDSRTEGSGETTPFPELLSRTGCVDPDDPTSPVPGMIPYSLNVPFWSDGAEKHRWFAIPDGATVEVRDDDWFFPVGSVVMKEFRLGGRRIETRLLVHHDDGGWAGYTYAWNAQETDAEWVRGGRTETFDGQVWTFPSSAQCLECHTGAAGRTVGLETAQLNRLAWYGKDLMANQLTTFSDIGVLSEPVDDPTSLPALSTGSGVDDGPAALADVARSYLHANCAHCHMPGSTGMGDLDLRHHPPLSATGLCNPAQVALPGLDAPGVLVAGDPEASALWQRMQRRDVHGMPPLASAIVDGAGVELLAEWIESLAYCGPGP